MSEDRRRERLRWRCRRGMLELDLILAKALEHHYDRLSNAELDLFEHLLSMEDTVLLPWLQGDDNPADSELRQLVEKIRQ